MKCGCLEFGGDGLVVFRSSWGYEYVVVDECCEGSVDERFYLVYLVVGEILGYYGGVEGVFWVYWCVGEWCFDEDLSEYCEVDCERCDYFYGFFFWIYSSCEYYEY